MYFFLYYRMVRLKKSANSKKNNTKSTNKKHKVAKKKTNPYLKHTKAQPNVLTRTPAKRKFYTIREDSMILQKISNLGKKSKAEVLNELAKELDRSYESLRDRIKRYLGRLSSNGKKEILKHAKT